MFNLELPWRVAKGAVSAATYRIGSGGFYFADTGSSAELVYPCPG